MTATTHTTGNMEKHYLYPGKVFSSKKPHTVDTILGSCVAVFLWDPVLQFGCINHFMLPGEEGSTSFKYGNAAISELIKRMLNMGSTKSNIKAKIFGGSEIGNAKGSFNIGSRNISFTQDMLKKEGIPIVSSSVGGSIGRKVIFHTASGDVLISYIKQEKNVEDQKSKDHKSKLSEK